MDRVHLMWAAARLRPMYLAYRSTQVPSGITTGVGRRVFLSITMPGVDLLVFSAGVDLLGMRITLLGGVT